MPSLAKQIGSTLFPFKKSQNKHNFATISAY